MSISFDGVFLEGLERSSKALVSASLWTCARNSNCMTRHLLDSRVLKRHNVPNICP